MPYRARVHATTFVLAAVLVLGLVPTLGPDAAAASSQKVTIIVGPVGPQTDSYRDRADDIAQTAAAAGATVEKVYSPNATWDNVREAVDGANIIVYLGHGNGYPNPYSSGTEWTDRVNGWGLNIEEGAGDGDTINVDMVYCGEKALRGTLSASDGAAQREHCAGGPITPAPGFVMVYSNACYTPGAGEGYDEPATESVALTRVASYSRPVLALGARAYFATDLGSARIVDLILRNPGTAFGALFEQGNGYSVPALRIHGHPHFSGGQQVWIQKTDGPGDRPDYFFAFAGNPAGTANGATVDYAGPVAASPFSDIIGSAFTNDIMWLVDAGITSGCGNGRFCPKAAVTREQMASFLVRGLKLPATSTDYFTDVASSAHRADINGLAASKVTGGCAEGRFCPSRTVTREQMASFLARALDLPASSIDYFADDAGSPHEADINRLAASGITGGCGTSSFCPSASITREQMAAFLHRALGK